MNMILHNNPTAETKQGNTLANPLFFNESGAIKTFDYVVANPPFSDKRWGNGVDAVGDIHGRFKDFGIPPAKKGDYSFLLHIIRSLRAKVNGRAFCRMEFSSGEMQKQRSEGTSSARDTSRVLSACLPTCFTAQAFRPVLS